MSGWSSRTLLAVFVVALVGVMVGCEDTKQLKMENQDLLQANAQCREALANKDNEVKDLRSRLQTAQVTIAERDAQIRDLLVVVNRPQPQQPTQPSQPLQQEPQQPSQPRSGGTGFEGTGDVTSNNGVVTVTLASDLLFDSGKATLKSTSKSNLSKIAGVIKSKYADKKIRVRGHTDSDPIRKSGWKDNWELSLARAKAVADYLVSQGVDRDQIELVAKANTEPRVSPEKTSADKAKNRRVDIQVVVQGG